MILLLEAIPSDDYTMGRLTVDGPLGCAVFHTLEPPWIHTLDHKGGANGKSCVPGGRYKLVPHSGGKWKNTWALVNHDLDVYHLPGDRPNGQGRYAIVFHRGSVPQDTDGCVLLGMDALPGRLRESSKAERIFKSLMAPGEHTLDIVRTAGTV